MSEVTEVLLAEAAVFLARDRGAPGFLDRFTEAVADDPWLASLALDRALAAQAQAGRASVGLEPGDLRVEITSSGASLTACALAAEEGCIAVSIRVTDTQRRPVAGAAVAVRSETEDRVVVTDPGGWVNLSLPGQILRIRVGGGERVRSASGDSVIQLPRTRRAAGMAALELAAAHEDAARDPDEQDRWRIEAGGVDFLCLDRKGGYDLTVLLTGVTADFADTAAGAYAAGFLTWGRNGRPHRWMVPLAPSPLGLAGSLYGTDEDRLDRESVEVRGAEQLISALGDQLDEVVSRSVRHSDALGAWGVLCRRLRPGRQRAVLEAALAEREKFL
jgi:RNase P/RNase MRP subunit p29